MEKINKILLIAVLIAIVIYTGFYFVLAQPSPKFEVKFEIEPSLIEKTLYITIRNFQDSSDNLDLNLIINSTNFDISEIKDVRFSQLKNVEYEIIDYSTICNPYETANGTISNCSRIPIGSHIETREEWIEQQLISKTEDGLKGELKSKWENVPIQKAGQQKDTLKFKMEFNTPITIKENGWGSKGIIFLDMKEKGIFYDLSNSSWWDENWERQKTVNITGGTVDLINFTIFLNVSHENMLDNFYDLRFVNGSCDEIQDLELKYEFDYIEDKNFTGVWILMPNLITGTNQICMYYNNSNAGFVSAGADAWNKNYLGF